MKKQFLNDLKLVDEMVGKLQATAKRLGKEAILLESENCEPCKKFLHFLFDPFTVTGLSDKKISKKISASIRDKTADLSSNTLSGILEYFSAHNTGRDIDIAAAQSILAESGSCAPLFTQILCKSLKLGVDAKTINKVYGKDFIKTFNVMLAMNWDDEKEYAEGQKLIITQKLDGHRCVAFHHETGAVKFLTRQGQDYGNIPDVEAEIKKLTAGFVYDGELLSTNENYGDNSAVQLDLLGQPIIQGNAFGQTSSIARKKDTKTQLCFHVFDMLPIAEFIAGESSKNALERKKQLHKTIDKAGKLKWVVEVEPLYVGDDIKQVGLLHEKSAEQGWEGIMVNIANAPYQCKRTKDLLKVKQFHTADVRVVAAFEGSGKYKGLLGGVTVEFEHKDKTWLVDCGSGFTEADRAKYWGEEDLVGRIIEVQYFEISQDKDGNYSLRFPVFLKTRDDKDEISMH